LDAKEAAAGLSGYSVLEGLQGTFAAAGPWRVALVRDRAAQERKLRRETNDASKEETRGRY
jgi:hypothetical protein